MNLYTSEDKSFERTNWIKKGFRKHTILWSLVLLWIFLSDCTNQRESSIDLVSAQDSSVSNLQQEGLPTYQPRFGRKKPVIAVIADNYTTEITDFVIPFAILSDSKAAEVLALGIETGDAILYPALKMNLQENIQDFDKRYPRGADYVIVPAIHRSEDPKLLSWIQSQAGKGAIVIGVCDGVWVLANAGLLKGHRATGHWYSFADLKNKFKETEWVQDLRYVSDRSVITTTGITASIPISLALVESISGKANALLLAKKLGVEHWGPAHNSSDFQLKYENVFTIALNTISFWSHEDLGLEISPGLDEIKLAFLADAYSRTYRSKVFSFSKNQNPLFTKNRLRLIPDRVGIPTEISEKKLTLDEKLSALDTLKRALSEIELQYGKNTADTVRLIMEYPRK
ncbi:hypothetical protein CH373_03890 [Leptospira perolatii]|uniref:DJ-1/PfpI domain-containing protein n=1 Tax=Leptospira perolatii TaxID=2023191 RepID=A0A2M9ZQ24_9LEPT|nr:hypothetical protein CH360_13440 [Leptospira perolatii]PJZ74079.1 hypothetical protein CH373_03890 [Leptospira perolatii]